MRLPLTANISTKDGVLAKNARMTNVLEQKNKSGKTFAEIRPGTETVAEFGAASGNGIVDFNGEIFSVYGSNLSTPLIPDRIGDGFVDITYMQGTVARPVGGASDPVVNSDGSLIAVLIRTSGAHRLGLWSAATNIALLPKLIDGDTTCLPYGFNSVTGDLYGRSNTTICIWDYPDFTTVTAIAGLPTGAVVSAISRKGLFLAGYASSGVRWIWSEDTGVASWIPNPATYSGSTIQAVSDTGDVVGYAGANVFYRRKADGTEESLGDGQGFSISSDGTVIGGLSPYALPNKPAIWTLAGGLQTIDDGSVYGTVNSISEEGSNAAGQTEKGNWILFKWNADRGYIEPNLAAIPAVAVTPDFDVIMSADGKKICGYCYDTVAMTDVYYFYIWEDGYDVEVLPVVDGFWYPMSEQQISLDSSTVAFVIESGGIYVVYKWDRGTGNFRSIATLGDKFFDFVQSTL